MKIEFHAFSTSMNAPCGMFTLPADFIRLLPFFCFPASVRPLPCPFFGWQRIPKQRLGLVFPAGAFRMRGP